MKISKKKLIFLLMPFILLTVTSIINVGIFYYSTPRVETVKFPSILDINNLTKPEVVMTNGHLFYPKGYLPTRTYPVVIVVHGFEVSSSTDMRLPLELTKRGFFVLAIDLTGSGHTEGIFKPFFWKCPVAALDWVYQRPDLFDLTHVGMVGHSLGGWSTFMASTWEAGHDNRLNCSITWAGVSNSSRFRDTPGTIQGFSYEMFNIKLDMSIFWNDTLVQQHNPVNFFTGAFGGGQPRNLLIIHGLSDDVVLPEQAIMANNTATNSSLFWVNDGHLLFQDINVIYKTIQWLTFYLQEQDVSFTDIQAQGFTFLPFYVIFLLQCLSIVLCTVSLIFIVIPKGSKTELVPEPIEKRDKNELLKQFGIIGGSLAGVIVGMFFLNYVLYNLMLTMLIGASILATIALIYRYVQKKESLNKNSTKEYIINHFKDRSLIISIHLAIFGIATYFFVSYGFRALLYYPLSVEYYLLGLLLGFGISILMEIFLRKGIQDQLPLKNRWWIRIGMTGIIMAYFIIVFATIGIMFLSSLATLITMMMTSMISTYLYEKTKNILTTALFQSIVVAFLMANAYFFFIL